MFEKIKVEFIRIKDTKFPTPAKALKTRKDLVNKKVVSWKIFRNNWHFFMVIDFEYI